MSSRALAALVLAAQAAAALPAAPAGRAAAASAGTVEPAPLPAHPREIRIEPSAFAPPGPAGRRFELAGGAVLFLEEDRTLPLVEIAVALRVGSFLDPPERVGLASLAAALLRRGGAGELDADALDARIDELGAEADSRAGTLRGGASLSVPSWNLEPGLDLLFDLLSRPRFQEDRLATAEGTLLESMGRRNDDPLELLEREWEWLLFGRDHFSTRPLTPAGLEAIGRDDLTAFHRRHWRPERLLFAVSGDVSRDEIGPRLERRLAAWAAAAGPPSPAAPWPPPAPVAAAFPGLYLVEAPTPQAKVFLGHRATGAAPWTPRQRAALAVLEEVLGGGGAISRIAGRLRTAEGIAYRAWAQIDADEPWPGDLRIFFEADGRNVARAVAACRQEIGRLRAQPVREEELAAAKRSLRARIRLSFETAESVAGRLAEDALLGRSPDHWREHYRAIAEIGAEELLEIAKGFLRPERLVYLVVGRPAELGVDAAPGAGDGSSALERAAGHPAVRLPARDPLTLEPVSPPAAGGAPRREAPPITRSIRPARRPPGA